MRINQIAREHHLSNKEILSFLASIGITGKSHSSSVDEETQNRILIHFGVKQGVVEEEEAAQPSRFKRLKRPRGWKPKAERKKKELESLTGAPTPATAVIEPVPEVQAPETPPEELTEEKGQPEKEKPAAAGRHGPAAVLEW